MSARGSLPARVAVSGGAGFIGSHTVELLAAAGSRVLVIDDLSHACGAPLPAGADLVEADCGSEAARRALVLYKPDAVLHLASRGGVQRARRDPGGHARSSLASSVAFFGFAVAAGAGRVVSASSGGTIYGDVARLPARESAPPAPVSAYGAAKLAEEVYLAAFRRQDAVETLALRYGNVYGPRQDGSGEAGLVAITCTRLAEGRSPLIFGDGRQSRDFVYVTDVAEANLAALASRRSGVCNVATGHETEVGEVVRGLLHEAGRNVDVERADGREGEVRRVCLDPSRAAGWLGWAPRTGIGLGLKLTAEYFWYAGGQAATA